MNSVKANSANKGLKLTKAKLLTLHRQRGLSYSEIARSYGVTVAAISWWAKRRGIEHNSRVSSIWTEPSHALSYLLGVLLGDGCLYRTKSNAGRIRVQVTDREFAEASMRAMCLVGLNAKVISCKPANPKHKRVWLAYASNVKFLDWYESTGPNRILSLAWKYPEDAVRGVYDSEGTIYLHRGRLNSGMCTTNEMLADKLHETLLRWNLHPTRSARLLESGKTFHTVGLSRSLEIKRFLARIVPTIKLSPR